MSKTHQAGFLVNSVLNEDECDDVIFSDYILKR